MFKKNVSRRQLISIMILIIMMFNSVAVIAADLSTGELIYEDEEQTIISGMKGKNKEVIIPDGVIKIKKGALKNKGIEKLILNEGIEYIEDEAFSNNKINHDIVIPPRIKNIGQYAFADNNITKVDFSKLEVLLKYNSIGRGAFQNNNIEEVILKNVNTVPVEMFMNNEIKSLKILEGDEELNNNWKIRTTINERAFAFNKLKEVYFNDDVLSSIHESAFHYNGRYVSIFTDYSGINSTKSPSVRYGHVVNPSDVVIRYNLINPDGSTQQLKQSVLYKYDPYDYRDGLLGIDDMKIKPDYIAGYKNINDRDRNNLEYINQREIKIIDGIPTVELDYEKHEKPYFETTYDLRNISKVKEGEDITEEQLLKAVKAYDQDDNDISDRITVSPAGLSNVILEKEYPIIYTVEDDYGNVETYKITIIPSQNLRYSHIKGTKWQFQDFTYGDEASGRDDTVTGLSSSGRQKRDRSKGGLAIPHINPYTGRAITKVEGVNIPYVSLPMSRFGSPNSFIGELVFGDPSIIVSIGDFSFNSLGFTSIPDRFDNLEYLGDNAFSGGNVRIKIGGKFPEMPKVKHIGRNALNFNAFEMGVLPEMPELEYLGDDALYSNSGYFNGQFPEMPKLRYLGNTNFSNTRFSSFPNSLPELEYIGGRAFAQSNMKTIPALPKIKYIGEEAFSINKIDRIIDISNVEHIEDKAFFQSLTQFGIKRLPETFPNLKYIGEKAFAKSNVSYNEGMIPDMPYMPKLEYIGDRAFESRAEGTLKDMPELREIGSYAFFGSNITNMPKELPKLERIGEGAFNKVQFSDSASIPVMKNLKIVGVSAFAGAKIRVVLDNSTVPNLEHIGAKAFANISGFFVRIGDLDNLKTIGDYAFMFVPSNSHDGIFPNYPKLEYIGNDLFFGYGEYKLIHDMPNVVHIGDSAFNVTITGGKVPNMPKVKYIGNKAFTTKSFQSTKMLPNEALIVGNDTIIKKDAFKDVIVNGEKQVILTADGKEAPNIEESEYHIVNPFNIGLVGKNIDNKVVLNNTRVLASQNGDNITFKLPHITGYLSDNITINKNQLIDGVYTHIYESLDEFFGNQGGNKYQFKFKEKTLDKLVDNNEVHSYLSLSTVNEEELIKGSILLEYDADVYEDIKVAKNEIIKDVEYKKSENQILITLKENLKDGTEASIPVIARLDENIMGGVLHPIHATLYDEDVVKGYDTVEYGMIIRNPEITSLFSNKEKYMHQNRVVKNLETDDYSFEFTLTPDVKYFNRSFNNYVFEYKLPSIEDKHPVIMSSAIYLDKASKANGWSLSGTTLKYESKNPTKNISIPPVVFSIKNPSKNKFFTDFLIEGSLIAEYTVNGELIKDDSLTTENTFSIYAEERRGSILYKNIKNPHYNGRHSFFYDNMEDKSEEFKWNLYYKLSENIKDLEIYEYGLDSRMKYTSINSNGNKIKAELLDDKNNIILSTNVIGLYEIDENIQNKVKSIKLKYLNLNEIDSGEATATIGSKLKNPEDINYVVDNNNNKENTFYSYMKTTAIKDDGTILYGNDFAFTNIFPQSNKLFTSVNILNKKNIAANENIETSFVLKSDNYFRKNIQSFDYAVVISKDHIIDDIRINKNLIGDYKVDQNKDGETIINLNFKNADIVLENEKSEFEILRVKTSKSKANVSEFKAHGILKNNEGYDVINLGSDVVAGIDTKTHSYSNDGIKISAPDYFSIKKFIGKGNILSQSLETEPGEEFFYRFSINNMSNKDRENFVLIDVLPSKGDFNNSSYRNELNLNKKINIPEGFKIEYLNQVEDINVSKRNIMKDLENLNWETTPNKNTKAIKITANSIGTDHEDINIDIPMITKSDLNIDLNGSVNINQFAYKHDSLGYDQALSNPVEQISKINVPKVNISFKKVSAMYGEIDGVIPGVKFVLRDKDGNNIDVAYSDDSGNVIFKDVPVGNYYIVETDKVSGYKDVINPIEITAKSMADANKSGKDLNIGNVKNERIEDYEVLIRNVEILEDLSKLEYKNIKNIYTRGIKSSILEIKGIDNDILKTVNIDSRSGEYVDLKVGKYKIKQIETPNDNGLTYLKNDNEYVFEISKDGSLLIGDEDGKSIDKMAKVSDRLLYYPNTIDYKTSTVDIIKYSDSGELLSGAEFQITNQSTGESFVGTTKDGKLSFNEIKPGLYSIKEIKAPKGYIISDNVEFIDVPFDKSEHFEVEFENIGLKVNINQYKIALKGVTKQRADNFVRSNSSDKKHYKIVEQNGRYDVRQYWIGNKINVNGKTFTIDENGSIVDLQKSLDIDGDSVLNIDVLTNIKDHYFDKETTKYINDYVIDKSFDGTINIDLVVKPKIGSIHISSYLIDEVLGMSVKEFQSKYGLQVYLTSTSSNEERVFMNGQMVFDANKNNPEGEYGNLVFNDLPPGEYVLRYSVIDRNSGAVEEEITLELENDYVTLSEHNSYTASVIVRGYRLDEKFGDLKIIKVDGDTNERLEDVEFTLVDKHGNEKIKETNNVGEIIFEELSYDLAPYKLIETRATEGYRLNGSVIEITEDILEAGEDLEIKNFKKSKTPETGTLGKLPFIVVSLVIITVAVFTLDRKDKIK